MTVDNGMYPDPAERRLGVALKGRPLPAGGLVWVFALDIPDLGAAWDRLYEQIVWKGAYEPVDVLCGAILLLTANYRLDEAEAADLIRTAPYYALEDVVHTALFGAENPDITFSDWVLSALYANGLNPATIPPEYRMLVVRQLAETGRCVPEEQFVAARRAAASRARHPTVADVLKVQAMNGEGGS